MTILVVEDEPSMQMALEVSLSPLGNVIISPDLPSAIREMRKIPPPDFIILDLVLPGSKAINTLEHINELRAYNPRAAIVVLTGVQDEKLAQVAQAMGADGFLHKHDLRSQKDLWDLIKQALNSLQSRDLSSEAATELLAKLNKRVA